ncbi:hypothetical protein M405DRAFT_397008 [Rhizopogon salebrosus TDB-379]|nr:hypothetical protein M405DRAFT_397008 [Rhizopogon salebrosus TDB-379]
MRGGSVDAVGTTSASCSTRCRPRRRDWLGSDVALSKSAGYTAGWARGSEFARSCKVSWIRLPAISHGCTRSIPSQMRAPRQFASSSPSVVTNQLKEL